ncbi:hypothetical protein PLESTB_000693000 [Pleodorina starrii]|uniref:Ribosomal protein S17 n=1 Tax=Pleodorina starrii TaxID=330485 RepID=A0A9W6BJL9_9CHLO|nr:hypothetical protein PLESTM_001224200 [Pleodorina starrii]GLC52960.1 hypothetical protein PLESTB_000693000 [Pleodorina starrii]GLC65256.1 hypothetical protein PLESTF_000269300 [Pleodorina starrii]
MGGFEFVGRVVSNRMQKTVVVAVSYVVWIPKYKVYQKRVSRHKARDDSQSLVIGDIVRIRKSRKYAKEVSYKVVDTLRRANVYDGTAAAALVAARDGARTMDWVAAAEARLAAADARLVKLREMYEREIGGGVSLSGGVLAVSNSGPQGTGSLAAPAERAATAAAAAAK